MRLKFLLTLTTVILLHTVLVTAVYISLIKNERLRFIDLQLRESALVLVDSELASLKKIDFKKADEIISDELGPNRIGKFFVIRNNNDEIVYESTGAIALGQDVPRQPQWVTIEDDQYFIRVLNLELPRRPDRTLQLGVVIDQQLISWASLQKSLSLYLLIILLVVLIISSFLTFVLLAPFRRLVSYLQIGVSQLKDMKELTPMPESLLSRSQLQSHTDEYHQLATTLKLMIERINLNYKLMRVWSARMAHEFKTPLSIIKAKIEAISDQNKDDTRRVVDKQIDFLSNVVSDYLTWAELQSTPAQDGSWHAIKVSRSLNEILQKLSLIYPNRIQLQIEKDMTVFMMPIHFEQLIVNLLVNGVQHSPKDSVVEIRVNEPIITMTDYGTGIEQSVLEKVGSPFNRGVASGDSKKDSTGLGLAICQAISKKYDVEMQYSRVPNSSWTLYFRQRS